MAFIQIYDRKPGDADKLKSPKFAILADIYNAAQKKLINVMEALHEPAYFAEQKRIEYEEACREVENHTGWLPDSFEYVNM